MKNMVRYCLSGLAGLMVLTGCLKDDCETTRTFVEYTPVWVAQDESLERVTYENPKDLKRPGKIYFYNQYILINEQYEGVHIIDNEDPSNPANQAFLSIPGNEDIAMTNGILYADNYKDILQIDISDIQNPDIVNRIENIKEPFYSEDFGGRYLLYYQATENTVEVACDDANFRATTWGWIQNGNALIDVSFANADRANAGFAEAAAGGNAPQGIAGSMARFALFNGYFYYVDDFRLHIYDASDSGNPQFINTIDMSWGIETIFPYENNLFIGANNGMHIFDNSNPAQPEYRSTFEHAQACDPVVVEDNTAYITLRDGTDCQNFTNQLDVVDVSDLARPFLIRSYPMHNPHGLAVRDKVLYLADGNAGLKIFDVEDPRKIADRKMAEISDYHGFDVISVSENLLLFIGQDGFFQYDTSNPEDPKLLSQIRVNRP